MVDMEPWRCVVVQLRPRRWWQHHHHHLHLRLGLLPLLRQQMELQWLLLLLHHLGQALQVALVHQQQAWKVLPSHVLLCVVVVDVG